MMCKINKFYIESQSYFTISLYDKYILNWMLNCKNSWHKNKSVNKLTIASSYTSYNFERNWKLLYKYKNCYFVQSVFLKTYQNVTTNQFFFSVTEYKEG